MSALLVLYKVGRAFAGAQADICLFGVSVTSQDQASRVYLLVSPTQRDGLIVPALERSGHLDVVQWHLAVD